MFKLFQRIIFACLRKEFFHVQTISYIAMVKIFFEFQFSVISPSLKLATQYWDAVRASPGVAILASIYE